jgi:hypothetical protein
MWDTTSTCSVSMLPYQMAVPGAAGQMLDFHSGEVISRRRGLWSSSWHRCLGPRWSHPGRCGYPAQQVSVCEPLCEGCPGRPSRLKGRASKD